MAEMKKKKFWRMAVLFSSVMTALFLFRAKKKSASIYKKEPKERNPMEGKKILFERDASDAVNADGIRGHLVSIGQSLPLHSYYIDHVKRGFDFTLSFFALLVLSPVFLILSIAIFIDDPGPVFFTQKRVGKNKRFFKLHKFRSMKMSTPHDIPTHMLDNPEQYITRVGKFIRAHSLDELPQIWDIFLGNMSIIGPRPALWNQDCLIAERDRYGANDILPGLSGWAQINGRDSIEIPDKAKLDGEYVEKIGFLMDLRCFFGTIFSVLRKDGVVEGGTGVLKHSRSRNAEKFLVSGQGKVTKEKSSQSGIDSSETEEGGETDRQKNKLKVLITGASSYIGTSFEQYVVEHYGDTFFIDTVDMKGDAWRDFAFSQYDIVFHVAGIAHADVGRVTEETKAKYYTVNTKLAIEVAEKAKEEGVKQFIFMSSSIIYGDSAPYGTKKRITIDTEPKPANFYGDSKWQADKAIRRLADEDFTVAIVRPPMIYGENCKGNFPLLSKLAKNLPLFPDVQNERSMIYIENFCEFLSQVMIREEGGIFWPQNAEYTRTSEIVKMIGEVNGYPVKVSKKWNWIVRLAACFPRRVSRLTNKAFGNMSYEKSMSKYDFNYQIVDFKTSIKRTEGKI